MKTILIVWISFYILLWVSEDKYNLQLLLFLDAVLLCFCLKLWKLLVFDWSVSIVCIVTVSIVTTLPVDYLDKNICWMMIVKYLEYSPVLEAVCIHEMGDCHKTHCLIPALTGCHIWMTSSQICLQSNETFLGNKIIYC